jgi:hypothetical protein
VSLTGEGTTQRIRFSTAAIHFQWLSTGDNGIKPVQLLRNIEGIRTPPDNSMGYGNGPAISSQPVAYSERSATAGSTFAALCAGNQQAREATTSRTNATPIIVEGSCGLVSKSTL